MSVRALRRGLQERGGSSMLGIPSPEVLVPAPRWSTRLGGVQRYHWAV